MKKSILSLLGLVLAFGASAQCPSLSSATLPFTENFDSFSGTISTDSIFGCTSSSYWSFERPGNTGDLTFGIPSGTANPGTDFQGTSVGMSSLSSNDQVNLVLTVDLSTQSTSNPDNIFLNFYYADFADEPDVVDRVYMRGSPSDAWIEIFDWSTKNSGDWEYASVRIDSFLTANSQNFSDSTQFRWTQEDNASLTGNDGFGLDNVEIVSFALTAPTAISFTNVTSNSIDVSWTSTAPFTEVVVDTAGFNPNTGTAQAFSGQSSATLSGLNPATDYEFWVRDSSGANSVSNWVGPFSFTTLCVANTAPFFTDFESTPDGSVENCWSQYNNYSTSAYARVEALSSTHTPPAFSGSNVLELYNYFLFSAGDTLTAITPQFSDMTAGDKQIRFQVAAADANTSLIVATLDNNTTSANITIIDTIDITAVDVWQEAIVYLNAANGYNGTDTYIALIHDFGGGTFEDIYIDDFNYEVIPPCPQITGVQLNSASSNSGTFSYTVIGDSIEVEWGPQGFTQGTGCIGGDANIGSITVQDALASSCAVSIQPQTSYDVYFRNNCTSAGDGFSTWVGPFTFTTGCAPIAAPYSEDFDAWDPGTGSTSANNDSISLCWSRDPVGGSGTYMFLVEDGSTGSSNTGPTGDNTGAGGNYLYTEASSGSTGSEAFLTSPMIDISGLTLPYVQFYLHAVGDDLDTLEVEYMDGGSWMSLMTIVGAQQAAQSDPYILFADTLNGLSSNVTQIRFRAVRGSSFEGDWSIDDFALIETPSCTPSTLLALDSATANTAYLSWSAGSGSSYILNVDTPGFNVGNGRFGDTTTVANGSVGGLMPNTVYEVYLRDVCSASNLSSWVGPLSIRTGCPAVFPTPALIDLEDIAVGFRNDYENCWSTLRSSNPKWEAEVASGSNDNSSNTGPHYDNTLGGVAGGTYWFLECSGGGLGDEANLTSKLYDLGGLSQPSLYFYYHMYGADMGKLHVDIEHQGTWYTDYYLIDGQQDTSGTDPWNQIELNLADFVNDSIRIRFRGERGNGFTSDMAIDDIEIDEATACNLPVNLQVNNLNPTSADISWSSYGSNFNVVWGPAGFFQGTATTGGTTINNATSPTSISGLSPNTSYDVYVEDPCNPGTWVGPLNFQTPCFSALAGGTYTIGPNPSDDFPSYDSVATLINGCGISGPVVFNSQPGSYLDKLHLQYVPGVSSTNTITFNGTGGQDTLIYNGQSYQTAILIEGTSYVTINDMIIVNPASSEAFGILLKDGSDSVNITNNTILMDTTNTSTASDVLPILTASVYDSDFSEGSEVDYLRIEGNTLIGGVTAINLEGNGTGFPSFGHRILNNTMRKQVTYGLYADEMEDIQIIGNTVSDVRGTTDGIYMFDINDFVVEENALYVTDYGLYISDGNDGYVPSQYSRVVNNMVSSTTDYGIYLNDFELVEVFHNTAYGSPGMAINDPDSVWVYNNVFVSDNDFAFETFDNLNGSEFIDYNLYQSGNANAFDIGTSSYVDLAAWQAGDPSLNVNSLEGDPIFVSKPDDLHLLGTLANDAGDNSVGVSVDIDGDVRPQAPSTIVDMGADEYTPLADDVEILDLLVASGCGDSTTEVSAVFRNVGQNTVSSLPITVNVSGGVSSTLNGTYNGNLASLATDTLNVGSFNTYAGANGVMVQGILALANDQDPSNDSLMVGPLNYISFEPVGFDSVACASDDTAYLRANSIPGVRYGWYSSNNTATDTIPLAIADTFAFGVSGAQSTYYLAYQSSIDSLGTSFGGGNGQSGNAFDILPASNIELTGLDLNLDATSSVDVVVYIRTGSYVGNETSLAGWSLIDTITVNANGAGNPTYVGFPAAYPLSAGQTYGLLVAGINGDVDYTNGTAVGAILAQNNDLTIFEGAGISWPLGSSFEPRFWNGRIYYNGTACSETRVPVNLGLGTDTASANFTVSGTQPSFSFDASTSVNADTYDWDFGDGNSGSGVSTNHTYASNGSYNVVLTVYDTTGCISLATDSTVIDVNVGIEENSLSRSLDVYPNPTSQFLSVNFDLVNDARAEIRLLDAQGRALGAWTETAQGNRFESRLDLSAFAKGVYILEVRSGELVAQQRISLQ